MRNRFGIVLIGLLATVLCAVPAFAQTVTVDEKGRTIVQTFDDSKKGSIRLDYQDEEDGSGPVKDAGFIYYLVATVANPMNGDAQTVEANFVPILTDARGDAIKITSKTNAGAIADEVVAAYARDDVEDGVTYEARTDAFGTAITEDMEPGIYLAVETESAYEHMPSLPFLFSIPFAVEEDGRTVGWCYEATAEPKPIPCGDIVVKKNVVGGDTKKAFTFDFSIDSDDEFHYELRGKEEGYIEDGDQFALSDGDVITIDTIPAGTKYEIHEVEANKDGYKTTVKGKRKGTVPKFDQAVITYTNKKSETPGTPKSEGNGKSLGSVKTGDYNRIAFWILLTLLGILMASYAFYRKKRGTV